MTPTLAVLLAILPAAATPGPAPLARKLQCIDQMSYDNLPSARWILARTRVMDLGRRMERFALYPDGEALITVRVYDLGSIQCRARLTTERLASFKADVARTQVWRAKATRYVSAPEIESVSLNLEGIPQRSFEMTPADWRRSPRTSAFQPVLDSLLRDICGGDCPEPKERKRTADRPPLNTLRIVAPPDAAPPKKP